MAFYLVHGGNSLYKVTPGGNLTTVSLPAGVTIVDTRPMRFAALAGSVVCINAGSVNFVLDPTTLATRLLSIDGPTTAPTIAAGGAGVMSGVYRVRFTYAILDGDTVLTESPFSPTPLPLTVTNQQIDVSDLTTSSTAGVNARILYSTTNGGVDYFEIARVTNNTGTTATLDTSDYDLALLTTAENKGNPPGANGSDRFRICIVWKDRIFASPALNPDLVHYSGNREVYSWGASNVFTVAPRGEDTYGVTAFMARRNELVMGKRSRLWKLIGDTPADYEQIIIAEDVGVVSPDAALVIRDTCYFLGEDGFYEYGPAGVQRLSRDHVHPWFTTDDFFSRAMFEQAFAKYNPRDDVIELHLAASGSSDVDRWVTYSLKDKTWFGPHKTAAFTPSAGGTMEDVQGFETPVIGATNGHLYRQNQTTASDDGTAIEMDVTTRWHNGNTPDILKLWNQAAILTKIEAGGTLSIIPRTGRLNAAAQATISHDLTLGRQRLRHLGTGELAQLRFYNNEDNQPVVLLGYELPFHELGRR